MMEQWRKKQIESMNQKTYIRVNVIQAETFSKFFRLELSVSRIHDTDKKMRALCWGGKWNIYRQRYAAELLSVPHITHRRLSAEELLIVHEEWGVVNYQKKTYLCNHIISQQSAEANDKRIMIAFIISCRDISWDFSRKLDNEKSTV